MASDASLTGGAICKSTGLTARGLGISRQAQVQRTSLCDDEVVLNYISDNLWACRRPIELLQFGIAAFVWIGIDPHAKRICRHACPKVLVLNGDEESLASAVFSIRSSHSYVKWVIIFAGCSTSGKESLPCENKSGQGVCLDGVVTICLTQLHRKWPSVRCASLLEGSIHLSLHARACVSNVLETDPIRVNASSVCPLGRESLFWFSSPVPWPWECQSSLSREVLSLHTPGRHHGGVSSAF